MPWRVLSLGRRLVLSLSSIGQLVASRGNRLLVRDAHARTEPMLHRRSGVSTYYPQHTDYYLNIGGGLAQPSRARARMHAGISDHPTTHNDAAHFRYPQAKPASLSILSCRIYVRAKKYVRETDQMEGFPLALLGRENLAGCRLVGLMKHDVNHVPRIKRRRKGVRFPKYSLYILCIRTESWHPHSELLCR